MKVFQLTVSEKIASGKCKPQISIRGLPVHQSGKPRSGVVASLLTFTVTKNGTAIPAELVIRDNGGCHESHQLSEVQAETFARIFAVLARFPGRVVSVPAELTDLDDGHGECHTLDELLD